MIINSNIRFRFMNITTLSSLFNWLTLFLATIQFRKGCIAQGVKQEDLPFTSKLLPYAAYYGVFMVTIFICENFSTFGNHPRACS